MEKFGKKQWITAVLSLICAFAVFAPQSLAAQTVANLDTAIQEGGKLIAQRAFGPTKVALVNYKSSNDLSAYVLREAALYIERNHRQVQLAARQDIDQALRTNNLTSFGEVSDAAARAVGRTLSVDCVVTGSLDQVGNSYRYRIRMINVSSGALIATTDYTVRDTQKIQQLLATTPAHAPGPAPAPAPAVPPAPAPAPAPAARTTPPAPAPAPAPAATGTYPIGGTGPAGGFIFYDKGNNSGGWRYLEAAPTDLPRPLRAAAENINVVDARERAVGRGKENTAAIMVEANNKGGGFGWAAQAVTALNINGFTDWFLPSRDELHHMYGNLKMNGIGDFRDERYWSSTASNSEYFWSEAFSSGSQDTTHRGYELRVRPVRRF
jgi:cell division septation protein DedD